MSGNHFARTDRNQAEIVKALRKEGCTVTPTHAAGRGFPDLAVGIRLAFSDVVIPFTVLMEVKDWKKPHSRRKLTPAQRRWHSEWLGSRCVVETVEDALHVVRELRGGNFAVLRDPVLLRLKELGR